MIEIFGGLPSWRLFYLLRSSCCRSPKLPAGCPVLAVVTDADAFAGAEETGGGCIREAISRLIQACCSGVNIGGSSDMGRSSVVGLDPLAIVRAKLAGQR